jgi:hypothetical protein
LETVTVTAAEVAVLPNPSLATALSVCVPLLAVVVFQEMLYGEAVSSAPRFTPSRVNCTPATVERPVLSEAEAVTVTVPETVPAGGALIVTIGAKGYVPALSSAALVAPSPSVSRFPRAVLIGIA